MTENMKNSAGQRWTRGRIVGWATAALLLLVPLVSMQFTDEVNWEIGDFVVFGILLLGAGAGLKLASRKSSNSAYKFAAGIAVLAAFLLFWINGAVGIIGSEDNDANLMYFGVLAIGLIGGIVARFEPRGMERAMYATAVAQIVVFVIALVAGWGFTGPITVIFVAMWFVSGRLFGQSAKVDR